MDLKTLRYFIALAQEGSVSAAAKSMHVTQPTLSRQRYATPDDLRGRRVCYSRQAQTYLDTVISLCEGEQGIEAMRDNAYHTNFSG